MRKAKSRLKTNKPNSKKKSIQVRSKTQTGSDLFPRYIRHLPTLLISLPFYAGVYLILTRINPHTIEDFLIPNTYLPLQLVLFLANFFLFSFLLLKSRRGFEVSLLINWGVFLKLQAITNFLTPLLGLVGILVLIEIGLTLKAIFVDS